MMLLDELNSTQSLLLRGINDVEEHVNNNSKIATSLSNSSAVVYNKTINSSEVTLLATSLASWLVVSVV